MMRALYIDKAPLSSLPMVQVTRETHATPPSVALRLRLAGGLNRFGEPNYRAIWGWNRLTLIGGQWEQKSADGPPASWEYRLVPKYFQVDRWHIERWCPPELYGPPELWWGGQMEREFGPYPARGEYELSHTVQGPRGEFVQLTPTIVDRLVLLVEYSRGFSNRERKAALGRREEKAERDYDSWAYDVLDDGVPAFSGLPHVTVL